MCICQSCVYDKQHNYSRFACILHEVCCIQFINYPLTVAMTNPTTKTGDSYVLSPRVVYNEHRMMTWRCLTNEYGLTCQARGPQQGIVLQPLMLWWQSEEAHFDCYCLNGKIICANTESLPIVAYDVSANLLSFQLRFSSPFNAQRKTFMLETKDNNGGFRPDMTLRRVLMYTTSTYNRQHE